jgi:apolipoprotein N-acyltransferase
MAVAIGRNGAPAVAVAEQPWRPGPRRLLAVTSGLLLSAAFPSLDLEPLAWVGLVPLLMAANGLRPRAAFGVGWLGGVTFYLATCYWVAYTINRYTTVPVAVAVGIVVIMAAALAVYHGAFVAGVRWFEDRGLPAVWLAPPLWVTLEWLRGWFFIGFPWAALGYSQYRYHDLMQIVEVTGVYGPSALLVLFNVVAAAVLRERGRGVRRVVPALAVLTALVILLPLWGHWRAASLAARPPAGTVRVALAQGNVEQDHKWDSAYQDDTMARYRTLTDAAAQSRPDLIVWPETATPFFFQQRGRLRDEVRELAERNQVHLLFGSPAFLRTSAGTLLEMNRAYLVSPTGAELASYDKMQLVPFGEYVPYARVFFFVNRIVEAVGTIVPGVTPTVFCCRAPASACSSATRTSSPRSPGGSSPAVAFLVNITNDAWYGRRRRPTSTSRTRRCARSRTASPRARGEYGFSAIIDPDGRIRWQGPLFEKLHHIDDLVAGRADVLHPLWRRLRLGVRRHLGRRARVGALGRRALAARRQWSFFSAASIEANVGAGFRSS